MGNYAKILKEICRELQIEMQSFSDDWAFRLEKDGKVRYIYGYRFGLDHGSVQQLCTDKSITSDLLAFYGIPHVKHFFFMNVEDYEKSAEGLLEKFEKVVCKANEGTGGNQVFLAETKEEMRSAAREIFEKGSTLAISPYIEIEKEYRAIVLDGEIKLIYSKERPFVVGDGFHTVAELSERDGVKLADLALQNQVPKKNEKILVNWKHNLGQGAIPVIEKEEREIARVSRLVKNVLQKVGIRFASIDVIKYNENYAVLEINSGVMMEHFSKVSRENYEIAKEIYKEAMMKLFD
ncbi:MAG: hypothetical protein J6M02_01795 [Clostridia bacterium]|nr:hypothetical protein [Clostridia bacterium]